jgi:hypothetical protein
MLAVRGSTAEASQRIVIELLVPSETFWGMNFQLMKTTAGLLKLGQDLRPDGIDLRLLREFRDATDCIQGTLGPSRSRSSPTRNARAPRK